MRTRPERSTRPFRARGVSALAVAGALVLASCSGAEEADPPEGGDGTTTTAEPSPVEPGPGDAASTTAPPADAASTTAPPPDAGASTTTPDADAGASTTAAPQEDDAEPDAAPVPGTEALPDPIAEAVEAWYGGGDAAASGAAAEVAGDREPGAATGQEEFSWSGAGTWRSERVGVVTRGEDVTLLVDGGADAEGWRIVGGWWPSLGLADPALGGTRHVLLIGSDARVDDGQAVDRANADALQVVGVDGSGGGGVLGIARDAWVPIPAGFEAKINAAMALGGPDAQVQAVSDAVGVPIEGYVLSGFRNMMSFVNAWGGLQMDVPAQVRDIEPGEQVLDGYDALWYGRERYTVPGGDFGRSANQGLVLGAIGLQVRQAGPGELPDLLTLVDEWFESDLDAEAILTMAAWAHAADPDAIGLSVAAGDIGTSADGQSIVLFDDAARADFEDFADGNLSGD